MSEPTTSAAANRDENKLAQKVLVAADELGTMLGISERTVWRLLSAQKIPRPLYIGGSVRWRVQQVNEWIESGCPAPPIKVKG